MRDARHPEILGAHEFFLLGMPPTKQALVVASGKQSRVDIDLLGER